MTLSRIRILLTATLMLALGACSERSPLYTPKQLRAVSAETRELMDTLGIDKYAPILMRVFKAEGKLEVWKRTRKDERFALLKTYEICRWSGDLGPKRKEGDRQAPEGFYPITPPQLNPRSSYFLAFDTGYPNSFDRALDRTGSNLMVHGDCSSRGCFAMTDKQMQEIFALARDAFDGGQQAFQMQIMPFRMTPANMHRFRNNENIAFWRMIKEGSDHFEATLREPNVQVCGKRYVFDHQPLDPSARFSASEACPASQIPQSIASAVAEKRKAEAVKLAEILEHEHATKPHVTAQAGHTPLPVHAIYKSRQVIRASLPSAGPEALTLLPGAEAGPTTELKQIARGEIQPAAVPDSQAATENTTNAGAIAPAAVALATPPPPAGITPATTPVAAIATTQIANAPLVPAQQPAAAPPALATQSATLNAAPPPNAISSLFGNVISAFAPAEQRVEAIDGAPAPDAPRPLPSPLRSKLAGTATLAPAAAGTESAKTQSDAGFLEKTFGALSLPGFGRSWPEP